MRVKFRLRLKTLRFALCFCRLLSLLAAVGEYEFARSSWLKARGSSSYLVAHKLTAKQKKRPGRSLRPPKWATSSLHTAIASSAVRFLITRVAPSSLIRSFFLNSLSRRVTVSRDAPIRCAISSWVTGA